MIDALYDDRGAVEFEARVTCETGADTWLRIIVAIGTLGKPPTEARH